MRSDGSPAARAAPRTGNPDLSWIYAFWKTVSPWIFVRDEDDVIIVPPNRVYKANRTAMGLLRHLDRGGRLEDIPSFAERAPEIEAFFGDLETAASGGDPKLESVAYDFSFTRLPVLGEIAVTYRCGNRCRFCYAGCGPTGSHSRVPPQGSRASAPGRSATDGPELSASKIERIIDIFRDEAKIPFFSFTGGEPLLRKDIERLVRHAVRRRLRVNLVTNGTLATPRRARSLAAAGLGSVQVSIESPDPAVHDSLCGTPGSWERTVAGIHAFLDAGVPVQTNSTVTRENRESLLLLPAFLASLGVRRFAMNLFIPTVAGPDAAALFVPYSEIGPFVERTRKTALGLGMTFLWYSPTPMCIFNPVAAGLGNKSCAACDGLVSVDPLGNILPCSSYAEPVGNLFESSFREIWFSVRAKHFKDKRYAAERCRSCDAFTACQGACPLYWDYAGCGELDAAWQRGKARETATTATGGNE
ncbi:MAG: radical SAM protein [Spirochaetes bacterium]|nr:radical SAM protein [Spirochaetota bacterium]